MTFGILTFFFTKKTINESIQSFLFMHNKANVTSYCLCTSSHVCFQPSLLWVIWLSAVQLSKLIRQLHTDGVAVAKTIGFTPLSAKQWIEHWKLESNVWCFILELFIQNYLKLRINYDFKLTLWEFNKNKMSELRPGRLSFSWLWNEFSCNAAPIATASRTLYYRLGKHSSSNGVQCPCAIYSEPSYYIAVQSISNTRDICDSSRRCA